MTDSLLLGLLGVLLICGGALGAYRLKGKQGLLGYFVGVVTLLSAGLLLKRRKAPPPPPASTPPTLPQVAKDVVTARAAKERAATEAITDPEDLAAKMRSQK